MQYRATDSDFSSTARFLKPHRSPSRPSFPGSVLCKPLNPERPHNVRYGLLTPLYSPPLHFLAHSQVAPEPNLKRRTKGDVVMKRTTTANTFAIAFATVVSLGIAPQAQGDDKGCSNDHLTGTIGISATGSIVAPPPIAGPFANVGTQTFDGKGGTTGTATVSQNGNILKVTITGTYTVNPDCTGSITLNLSSQNPPLSLKTHAFFVIDDSGAEVRAIQTDPGAVPTVIGRGDGPANKRGHPPGRSTATRRQHRD